MIQNNFKQQFKEDVFKDILGQKITKKQLKSVLLVGRHVIIIGPPGIGKTTIAKNIAKLLPEMTVNDCQYNCDPALPLCPSCKDGKPTTKVISGEDRFVRVQGSPDLTAEDLLGDIDPVKALKEGPTSMNAFTPGKIFKANNGVLFFDELNRCPEKIQNSLLQVLEEGRATIGTYTIDLPANFIFIGTMNPEETAATEKLSDVFLDRFDTIHMTYPDDIDIETSVVKDKGANIDVEFPEKLLQLSLKFVQGLRNHKDIQKKPSVRASLGLYERAQSNAFLEGRKIVTGQDVSEAIISVLSHRIELKPSVKYLMTPDQFIGKEFKEFSKDHPELESGDYL